MSNPDQGPLARIMKGHTFPQLQMYLLGGFRVEADGIDIPESAWQKRRAAKALVKLLALEPSHALHRDQILEYLWPDARPESAANSLGKALHVARRALEPGLQARGGSAYIYLRSDVLSLAPRLVQVDVDRFRYLATRALEKDEIALYEEALGAYEGELLPEDRYEDWVAQQNEALKQMYLRVLSGLAKESERRGAFDQAADQLRELLSQDETREDIHQSLMRVYVRMGSRHQALRQYQECRAVLRRELDTEPESETEHLYQNIRIDHIERPRQRVDLVVEPREPRIVTGIWRPMSAPFVGREPVLQRLIDEVARADKGQGSLVLVSGEPGVGKTRLVAELVKRTSEGGKLVLWGTSGGESTLMPYGPFVEALENYVARCPEDERQALAARYPELVRILPSLAQGSQLYSVASSTDFDRTHLFPAIVRLLTDLSWTRRLLLVLTDLHVADSSTVHLLQYLARLAIQRRWLVVGTYSEEDMPFRSELRGMLRSTSSERFCRHIELSCLARQDCDRLVSALLPDGTPNDATYEYLYALSLGNPLFIEELVTRMKKQDELRLEDGLWHKCTSPTHVPARVRSLVQESIERLDQDVQRILALASVIGREFTFDELKMGATALRPPVTDGALLDVLDQALQARILEEREDGYAFRHPLYQATVSEHLSHNRRAQLHAALTSTSMPKVHVNTQDHITVVGIVDQVVDRARQMTPGQAATDYGQLIDRLDEAEHLLESALVREKLASCLIALGKHDRAIHVLKQAEQVYRSEEESEGLARVVAQVDLIRFRSNHLTVTG
jgi:DNA-binding SARP family transcriptional activator/DNA polymerase III delta prime subunit